MITAITEVSRPFIEREMVLALGQAWNQTNQEHLYLVTDAQTLQQAQQRYRRHFRIETLFFDAKSRGFSLDKSGIRHPERLARFVINEWSEYIFAKMPRAQCGR